MPCGPDFSVYNVSSSVQLEIFTPKQCSQIAATFLSSDYRQRSCNPHWTRSKPTIVYVYIVINTGLKKTQVFSHDVIKLWVDIQVILMFNTYEWSLFPQLVAIADLWRMYLRMVLRLQEVELFLDSLAGFRHRELELPRLRRWPLLWKRIIRRQQQVHPSPAAMHRLRPHLLHTRHVLSLLLSKTLRLKHRTI